MDQRVSPESPQATWKIRKARSGEAPLLSQLALQSKAHWGYGADLMAAWHDELEVSEEMIREYISYVATQGDRVVGFWCREPRPDLSDGRLFIAPDCMGQGVGRLLWEAVMAEARRRGLPSMVWLADPNAEGFYLRMGAVRVGLEPSSVVPGRMLPVMRLDLG